MIHISFSSVLVVAAFLGIVFVIVSECWPLFLEPTVDLSLSSSALEDASSTNESLEPLYFGANEDFSAFYSLNSDGTAQIYSELCKLASPGKLKSPTESSRELRAQKCTSLNLATGLETWLATEKFSNSVEDNKIEKVISHDAKNFLAITKCGQRRPRRSAWFVPKRLEYALKARPGIQEAKSCATLLNRQVCAC